MFGANYIFQKIVYDNYFSRQDGDDWSTKLMKYIYSTSNTNFFSGECHLISSTKLSLARKQSTSSDDGVIEHNSLIKNSCVVTPTHFHPLPFHSWSHYMPLHVEVIITYDSNERSYIANMDYCIAPSCIATIPIGASPDYIEHNWEPTSVRPEMDEFSWPEVTDCLKRTRFLRVQDYECDVGIRTVLSRDDEESSRVPYNQLHSSAARRRGRLIVMADTKKGDR